MNRNKYKGKILYSGRGRTIEQNNKKIKKPKEKYVIADMIYFPSNNGKFKTYIDSVHTGKRDSVSFDFVRQKELHKAKHYASKSYAQKRASVIGRACEIDTLRVIPVSKLGDYEYHNPIPRRPRWF